MTGRLVVVRTRLSKRARLFALFTVAAAGALALACGATANAGRLPRGARVDRLVVYKSERRMEAYRGETLLETYDVAVGSGGAGPKTFEGDGRTPEGTYRIDSRHRSREFRYFLHVSYPNADDRRRHREGLADGTISEGRGIGGDIGVHGYPDGPAGLMAMFDWTAGCIAVDNAAARELYGAVVEDAVIEIRP